MSAVITTRLVRNGGEPRLKDILAEASCALARLDAGRLEEMTLSCVALVREAGSGCEVRNPLLLEYREAWKEMDIFKRVLEATKANLNVMRRIREIRTVQLEYGPGQPDCRLSAGSGDVDH